MSEAREFFLTQTSLKDLEKESTCPFRWKSQWLDGEIPFATNEAMDRGKFFEYLCIGGGATADEVTDLPRLRNGEKSSAHIRIEEQVEEFKKLFLEEGGPQWLGHKIIETQLLLKNETRKGTVDFVTEDENGDIWLFDLKLTSDVESTRSQYGWGHNWDDLDLVQLYHYADLFAQARGKLPRAALAVFDYSPRKGIKINELLISEELLREKEQRFSTAEQVINEHKEKGWTKVPSEYECKNCPLMCDKRYKPCEE